MFEKKRFRRPSQIKEKLIMRNNSLEVERFYTTDESLNYEENKVQSSNLSSKVSKKVTLQIIKDIEKYTDKELVSLFVLSGDEHAFNEIFKRYNQKVKWLALKKLSDIQDAEDTVQEVFTILLKSMHSFRGESQFSTWLYAITSNKIRSKIRSKIKDRNSISIDTNEYLNTLASFKDMVNKHNCSNNPEELNINQQSIGKLYQELESAPKKIKETIVLKDINELSNQEVADQLGITLSAVKSRVHRSRQFLKASMGKNYAYNC